MPIMENYTLWIQRCRLSFPHLLMPKAQDNGPAVYSASFIMQDSQPEWAEAMQIIGQMAQDKWADKAQMVLNLVTSDKRLRCYGNGNEQISKQTGEVYDGYKEPGTVYIGAKSDPKPRLYGPDAQPLPPTANANQMFVGGNYVAAIVRFWPQDNTHGRAIRCQLVGVQYIEEGEKFGAEEIDAGAIFQAVPGAPAPTAAAPGMPASAPAPGMSPMPTGAAPPTIQPAAPAAPAAPQAGMPSYDPKRGVIDFL